MSLSSACSAHAFALGRRQSYPCNLSEEFHGSTLSHWKATLEYCDIVRVQLMKLCSVEGNEIHWPWCIFFNCFVWRLNLLIFILFNCLFGIFIFLLFPTCLDGKVNYFWDCNGVQRLCQPWCFLCHTCFVLDMELDTGKSHAVHRRRNCKARNLYIESFTHGAFVHPGKSHCCSPVSIAGAGICPTHVTPANSPHLSSNGQR